MANYLFRSARLGFRKWEEDDLHPFAAMCSDPAVMQYFPQTLSFQETQELVTRINTHFEEKGYGLYAVELLSIQSFVGFIGFSTPRFQADFTPCTEIGWRLQKEVWGNGLATEGAMKCLEYGFEQFHFPEIVSFTSIINRPSIRVMEKAGMQFAGTFDHPLIVDGSPLRKHVLYKISNP